jgi:hypothetical protein
MDNYKIGTLQSFTETQKFKTSEKKSIIIKTDEKFPQELIIDFWKTTRDDKILKLNNFSEGDKVKVYFNITGRSWQDSNGNTKYFISLQGWSLAKYAGEVTSVEQSPDRDDDMPF